MFALRGAMHPRDAEVDRQAFVGGYGARACRIVSRPAWRSRNHINRVHSGVTMRTDSAERGR